MYKVSLAVTIIGLLFLFFYAEKVSIPSQNETAILPHRAITMQGKISSLRQQGKAVFLEMLQEKVEPTTIILFPDKNTTLSEGDFIEVTGVVEEYNGQTEIVANKVVRKN